MRGHQSKGFGQESCGTACAAGVATTQLRVQHERSLCKKGKQWMVAMATETRGVVATLGSLLGSTALEDGAVQIQAKALGGHGP